MLEKLKKSSSSWRQYLYAPNIYDEIIKANGLCEFLDLAKPIFGIKTGCNRFFYLKDEDINYFGLSIEYFKPLLKSVGQLESTDFREVDTEWRVLDVQYLVDQVKGNRRNKRNLKRNEFLVELKKLGHNSLVKYIQKGESDKINEIPSIRGRSPWWSLGELQVPTFAFTKEVWKEFRTPVLSDNMICDQHLYPIFPNRELSSKQRKGLGAILNSNLIWLMREVNGREASGQHMARNEITVDEVSKMMVPDVRIANQQQLEDLGKCLDKLIKADRENNLDKYNNARGAIDKLCLQLIGNPCSVIDLQNAVEECVERRMNAGHQAQGTMFSENVTVSSEDLNVINKSTKKITKKLTKKSKGRKFQSKG